MSQTTIARKSLLEVSLGEKTVNRVDVREIKFLPGQETGRHQHPCPVVGYIVEGEVVLQIEGQALQRLPAGSAFYEPADTVIARFDNASSNSPLTFIAYYLLEGAQPLIEMLSK